MKIVFIDPKGDQVGLNMGLAYLASSLIKAGHTVNVIDFNNYHKDENNRLKDVYDADIIGFSIKSFTIEESNRLLKKVKGINGEAKIVCGGAHISTDGARFINEFRTYDIAIIGDGEDAIVEIASGKLLKDIKGIVYLENGYGYKTQPRELLQDLDRLPFPNYDCFDSISKYKINWPYNNYPLITSRGCCQNCIYCSVPLISGRRWRSRSPENVYEELKLVKDKYGIKAFQISDDNFTVNIERAKQICRLIKPLLLEWECPNGIKGQFTDEELIRLMAESGMFQVNIGIESAVPEVFNKIGKGGTLDDIKLAIKRFNKYGVRTAGFFLVGMPFSSYELDKQSLLLSAEFELDQRIWSFIVPYPGTRLFDMIEEKPDYYKMVADWRTGQDLGRNPEPIFERPGYSTEQLTEMYYVANIKSRFYGAITDMNSSNVRKAWDILSSILLYDPLNLPVHLYHVWKGLRVALKNKTVKVGW